MAAKKTPDSFQVDVDYGASLEDLIAKGQFDKVDPRIPEAEFLSLQFEGEVTAEAVREKMEELGVRPATSEEVEALKKSYTELADDGIIVAKK